MIFWWKNSLLNSILKILLTPDRLPAAAVRTDQDNPALPPTPPIPVSCIHRVIILLEIACLHNRIGRN